MSTRKAQWKNDAQFNYTGDGVPVLDKVEVLGVGNDAYLTLKAKAEPVEDIDFNTPSDYSYDDTKVEISGGKARLKAFVAGENDWPFTVPGNYTYDGNKIEVVDGKAKLKGTPYLPYVLYHLNEAAGANVPDTSGNGRDGTCINMEDGDWVAGKLNNCLRFGEGGDCEYVDCGNIGGFDRLDTFSFEFWINTATVGWPTLMNKMLSASPRTGYGLGFQSGILRLRLINTLNTNSIVVRNSISVNDGAWHHVIVTYDGSSLASGVRFYVDGALCGGNIVDHDNLTGSILNGSSLWIGWRTGFSFFDGYLDEVVVYDKELVQAEVTQRYNGGSGTEALLGAYPEDNPSIVSNNGFPFANPLGAFIETATKPESEIKYHVSCDGGATWQYWDGSAWVVTDDSYDQANDVVGVDAHIDSLSGCGDFRFRALLHSSTGATTPELDDVYIAEGVSYTLTPQEVVMGWNIQPAHVFLWLLVTEMVNKPANTDIEYQYSIDGGVSWNGSWLTAVELEDAIQTINCGGTGTDVLKMKILLSTVDSLQTPEIDNLAIKYHTGYEDVGCYTSTKYLPGGYWNGIYLEEVTFDIKTPIGTSITIRARAVEEVLEENYNKPWTQYVSGDSMDTCGYLVQWCVEMNTIDPKKTPRLNWVEIVFHTLVGVMRSLDAGIKGSPFHPMGSHP